MYSCSMSYFSFFMVVLSCYMPTKPQKNIQPGRHCSACGGNDDEKDDGMHGQASREGTKTWENVI